MSGARKRVLPGMQKILSALLPGILFAIAFFHIVGAMVLGHGYDALTYTTMTMVGWSLALVFIGSTDAYDGDPYEDELEVDLDAVDTSGEV